MQLREFPLLKSELASMAKRHLPRHYDYVTPAEILNLPAAVELVEKVTPIFDAVKKEGKTHLRTMNPTRVGFLAHQVRIQINESLVTNLKSKGL